MASAHHADSSLYELASQFLNLGQDKIESIFPGTPFQRDVVDCAADSKQRAIGHVVFDIPSDIDSTRLAAAWRETVYHTPALRTCTFTSQSGDVHQVVLKDSFVFSWMSGVSLDLKEAVVHDEAAAALAGPRCNRFVLLEDSDTKKQQLIWTYSHALVDGAFQERILRRVLKAYKDAGDENPLLLDTPDSSQATPEEDVQPNPSKMLKIPQAADVQRAKQFWRDHLSGLNASAFPHLPSHLATLRPEAKVEHHISYSSVQQRWSSTSLCRAALAILLSRYTNSPEALFGVVTEQAPHFEEQLMLDGPTRTVVPLRVMCAGQPVSDIMTMVDAYDDTVHEFAHAGLCNIASTGDDGSAACGFQTVLLVSDGDTLPATTWEILKKTAEPEGFVPCTNRALLLTCQMSRNEARLVARYDQSVIKPQQMTRFLKQLGLLIQNLQSSTEAPSAKLVEMVTEDDMTEIETWNSDLIQAQDKLIHREMLKWASDSPDKPAVSAWNGQWSYTELDHVSSRLAQHILSIDLGEDHAIIPIYFEKSKWVVASMLAVLKAGHAFTLIDPSDPPARTRQVVGQTSASIALTSKIHRDTVEATVGRCIIVDDEFIQSLAHASDLPTVQPSDLAYVIFTSGSTGDPKGIMIEHQSFASCATRFGPALGIHSGTRALQFGSHAFGACILEIMTTLIHGGCVCIPSDDDRMNNVPDFINRYSVNWVMATPSYMGTFQPEIVPGLKTLVLVGEQMSPSINDIWASRLQLLNGYGQSESSSICCVANIRPGSSEPNNIGRAVGARSWIVDPEDPNRLAPIGAIGELVIESPGIARGYIVAPSPDDSSFIRTAPAWYPSKQLPQGFKMYRTGDLASYASDGSIVCLGRVDSQVKIRGQRVELGAVETHLRKQMPDDMPIVVEAVKLSDASSTTALTAFLIDPSKTEGHILDQIAARNINTNLEQLVPRHSVPSFYISMPNLPRTATGKVDRRRLRIMGSKLLGDQTRVSQPGEITIASPSDTDAKFKSIWLQSLSLGHDSANEQASFFELGGNSITAIKMVNLAKSNGFDLKVSDIYQNPTLAGLKAIVTGSEVPYTPIPKFTRDGPVSEQSYAQSRMWFLEQLDEGALWYLNPFAVRMRGRVDVDALTRALSALEQRHETLRTTFENRDGSGVQVIHEKLAKGLQVVDAPEGDADGLKTLYHEETTGFDLTHDAGWRATLIRLGNDDHILSVIIHHIISDGWSFDVVRRELIQLYAAAIRGQELSSVLSPLPIQYSDFSAWQKQESQAAEHDRQLQYWKKQLADSAPAQIPTDFPRPALLSGEAGVVPVNIDGGLYQQLQGFCSRHDTTPFSVLLAAFRAAHYRLTAVDDAVIGYPIANRNRRELENMIGFFVNTQCMRIPVSEEDSFESLVRQVTSTSATAFEHEDVPFERVVSAVQPGHRDLSRTPLAQIMFAVHSQKNLGRFELEGVQSEAIESKACTRFDVEFHFFQESDGLKGICNFAADLFKPETIQNVVDVFFQTLRRGLDAPETTISVLPLNEGIADLRKMDVLDIVRYDYPKDSSVIDVFSQQVAAHPNREAVVDSSTRLTYAQLDRQSGLVEKWLRRRNLAPETFVAVLSPRSCETIVAFLGTLKANLTYLPLDVKSPVTRMRDILSSVPGPTIVLMGSDVDDPGFELPQLELVRIAEASEDVAANGMNDHTSDESPSARSLAFVVFTSGSTGKPKGVMIEHRAIIRLVKSDNFPKFPRDSPRMSHMFNIAFDGAQWEIYWILLNGGTLVCVDYLTTLDAKELGAVFAREQINMSFMAPAMLKLYLTDAPDIIRNLDVLTVGGERFDPKEAIEARALVRGQVSNAYGPTEGGIVSTAYNIPNDETFANGVPIGGSIYNSGAYIMDPAQKLVGPGVMGELVITGDGIARGYTNPDLNKNRFVDVDIDGKTFRAYRTGDRMRRRAGDCLLEFFGRMDSQFKIRGNRIEAGEVESAMLSHNAVINAAVVVRGGEDEGQPLEMVGFIVVGDSDDTDFEHTHGHAAEQVRQKLQSLLPAYMIPASIVVLDKMPFNTNGKIDRKELTVKAKDLPKQQTATPVPDFPITDIEIAVCEEATEVFGMSIAISDNFFSLGGHSLLASKLVSRIDRRLHVRVSVKDVFDNPVFADLAVIVRQGLAAQNLVPEGHDKQDQSSRVAPRTDMEKMLCEEYAQILGVPVGITDSFFDLGGHSLMATKLAARIGQGLNTNVTVKDIFDYPVIFQFAKKLESAQSGPDEEKIQWSDYAPFQLLDVESPQDFVQTQLRPQLDSRYGSIQDVYLATSAQKGFLMDFTTGKPRVLVPFCIDFPRDADCETLTEAIKAYVDKLDIFRTVFLEVAGVMYQVVVENPNLAIETIETEFNLNKATKEYLEVHGNGPVRLGHICIQFAILKTNTSTRVLLQMSHALYDGLSFEHLVRGLHILYSGKRLPPPTQFSRYIQYSTMAQTEGYPFWRDVLQNAPVTVLHGADSDTSHKGIPEFKVYHSSRIVNVPAQALRNSKTTQATIFNAACAIVMARVSGSQHVVFGRTVSGRQGLPAMWQDIIGPCTNSAPVHAYVDSDGDHARLIRDLSDQYLRTIPFESIGFEEIKHNCTDWPEETTNYSILVAYHNFEYHPESQVDDQRVQMGILAKYLDISEKDPLYDFAIAGEVEPDGISLNVTAMGRSKFYDEERVKYLLDEICDTFMDLNEGP
ncbi:hypothetical protein FGRMN_2752 [Fusarium graminum]|nr:hypothetical protein FGRMN_2752 [Fusarium graminum]